MPIDESQDELGATLSLADESGAPRALLEAGVGVGRYVILEPVGRGGMGVVYKAHDPELSRPVALKLLPTAGNAEAFGQRLLREAQALAQLSHPNVVAVYDAGTFGANVFVAMEFIEGQTLRQWLKAEPRSVRAILDVFAAAGDGLAAAHRAGIVHRDFKPDNVVVGDDARVRVLDFGIARTTGGDATSIPPPGAEVSTSRIEAASTHSLPPLTKVGAILGTPQYMAPEQHRGASVDGRADQFAFCVSLYEALYGFAPFAGKTVAALRESAMAGRVAPAPAGSMVPKWLRRVLLRGLSAQPEDRYPSMLDLVAALRSDPVADARRRLRNGLALGAFAVVLATALVLARGARRRAEPVCAGSEGKLSGVWDDARRRSIATAFEGTGKPYARPVVTAIDDALDRYSRAWVAMREDACKATRVRGEQSEELLDLRMACLGDRLTELGTLTELLAKNGEGVLEHAVQSAQSLPSLEACADVAALRAPVPPPSDATTRAAEATIRGHLAMASALEGLGLYEEGEVQAQAAVTAAEGLNYRPIQAAAQLRLGQLQALRAEWTDAERSLHLAYSRAIAGHHDEVAASAATAFMAVAGQRSRFEEGERWSDIAEASIARLGTRDDLSGTYFSDRARMRNLAGKYELSLADARHALELQVRSLGPGHHRVSVAYNHLGQIQYNMGDYAGALASFQQALSIDEKELGPDHPSLAPIRLNMANVHGDMGDHELAIAEYVHCLTLYQRRDPKHTDVAAIYNNMGEELRALGRFDEALDSFRRAVELWNAKLGPSRFTVTGLLNMGAVETELGHFAASKELLERSLAMADEVLGAAHPRRGDILTAMARLQLRTGQPRVALATAQQALTSLEKSLGPKHPRLSEVLLVAGSAELELHDSANAVVLLERGLDVLPASANDGLERAALRFQLARALGPGERPRAVALAKAARDGWRGGTGDYLRDKLRDVDAWLATHS